MSSAEQRQRYATRYLERGYAVIPVPAGEKNPNRPGWQDLRLTLADVPVAWSNGANIGVLTGEPSGWRVDVDLDADEAVKVAGRFMPLTLTSGRESRPHSHWWYFAVGTVSQDWRDVDGVKLVELRAGGRQTLVAPSTHPSGDAYVWHGESGLQMAEITAEELRASVNRRRGRTKNGREMFHHLGSSLRFPTKEYARARAPTIPHRAHL
ncbi:MAG: bifunctional DNA primase/polymerase, partial [Rubrobacteraceae bacterium]